MDKSFRIRTEVGKDKVVHVNLQQDYSFLEILSLKLNQIDTYKLHVSNYGVLVGRVVANGNFGIPNVKLSVFVPLDEDDSLITEIKNLYPYESTHDKNSDNLRYNLLSDFSNDDCYRVIGSFPNKRLVLDNDTYIEIFDKYYKYTTVTNKSGDYMIPFVPCGTHEIHSDLDLSDIGILSQRPIDLMYKGYNETQFDNPRQFKEGDNLNNLVQVISQNNTVEIYPFWGDTSMGEIAISRCDIEVQYKFEPTCVFFGSIISDNFNNAIGHKCSPSKYSGFNRHLVTGEGTIEMIRKTPDNLIEEFQIQGNRLIDGDGVWCYQIPMNLDYVGTDEFGNIVPTDNPNKGIPTRTSVRFRISMQETNNEGVSRHRAKYLVPNVQDIVMKGNDHTPMIENANQFDRCYEFGSATPDEYFRDLYWNKVYSVKNYIPRLQTNNKKSNQNYSAIKSVNSNNNLNPLPYNHARYRLVFAYRVLCMIMTIVIYIICIVNKFFGALACLCIKIWKFKVCPFRPIVPSCIGFNGGLTEDEDNNNEYFPCCPKCGEMECDTPGCTQITDEKDLINTVQQTLSQEYDTVNLDFYNDWLNGSLYMPLWFWKKTKKKKYFFGLFSKKAVNSFCSCGKNFPKLRVTENCSLPYTDDYDYAGNLKEKKYHDYYPSKKTFTIFGVIKEFLTKSGLNVYYYAPGIPNDVSYRNSKNNSLSEDEQLTSYVRLYSTDIILLGSLNSCDLDNYPNVFSNLPSTTANVPFIATIKQSTQQEDDATYLEDASAEKGYTEITGMDWLHEGEDGKPKYGAGLFIDLACNAVYTKPKSCINVARLSELGVGYDMYSEEVYSKNNKLETNIILADGMITRYEIVDHETRAMFASLNNNGLKHKIYNPNTGYETYKLRYVYPNDFDGHLDSSARNYTSMMDFKTRDVKNQDYIDYKFGLNTDLGIGDKIPYYANDGSKYTFPLFNNSFYFYFGLNEGKTAIDKFNKKYNAVCYKNEKYPFTFNIETTPSEWCIDNTSEYTEYATINIIFNTIKTPYSYTLYNEFNEELISENGLTSKELKFGYESKEGEYTEKKDGRLQYILNDDPNEKYVKNENGEYIVLENGIYTIEIIDASGNKGSQKIIIDQVPISVEYETVALGNKYYSDGDNKSKIEDFCNDNQFYGEIRLTAIIIDGNSYTIINCNGSGNEYTLTLNNGKQVLLEINPTEENFNNFYNDCTCKGVNGIQYAKIENEVLIFNVWIPQNYDLTVTEICDSNPIPNTTKTTVSVLNGEPFNVFINEVPLRLIVGKNEEPLTYNKNLYDTSGKPLTKIDELIGFWNNINDEEKYTMPSVSIENKDVWSDFVTVNTELNEVLTDNNEQVLKQVLTDDTKMNILKFKFQSIFNLCKTSYVLEDGESLMQLSYKGGKKPYLIRGVYPQYDEITEDGEIENYTYDSNGYVACETSHPNIVGFNYTTMYHKDDRYEYGVAYREEYEYPRRVIRKSRNDSGNLFDFNTLIDYDKYTEQGNYFAAFTNNGGYCYLNECGDEDKCTRVRNKKYQQYPYSAASHIDGIFECPSGGTIEDYVDTNIKDVKRNSRPYFRGLFIDKRLDYSAIIITPYAGNDIANIVTDDSDSWKKGCMHCELYNGIAMNYKDTSYEIISYDSGNTLISGDTFEYYYNDDFNTVLNTITKENKRFFKADLILGNKNKDIRKDIKLVSGNYPEIRSYYNKDIEPCNSLGIKVQSCSYDIDMTIEDDGENQIIKGVTQGVGETSFEIDCRDMINPQMPTLEECATNDTYNCVFNILYKYDKDTYLLPSKFKLEFKLKQDSKNTSHSIFSYIPKLIYVKKKNEDVNYLNKIKEKFKILFSGDTSDTCNVHKLREVIDEYTILNFWPTEDTDDNFKADNWLPNIGRFFSNKKFFKSYVDHWRLNSENDTTIAFDDNTEIKNIVYSCDGNVSGYDVLCVIFYRNYLNMSGDGLTKEIVTIQPTSLFDIRKIQISVTEEKIVELNNAETTTSGTTSVDVPTSSTETDADGNTTTTTGNTNVSGDIDASSTTKVKIQYTKYTISWNESDNDVNQQFLNSDKMVAIFKTEGKITSNINITSTENSATFDVYWNGDLEDTLLGDSKNCKLFIQMPNKLIYLLEFKHKKGRIIDNV